MKEGYYFKLNVSGDNGYREVRVYNLDNSDEVKSWRERTAFLSEHSENGFGKLEIRSKEISEAEFLEFIKKNNSKKFVIKKV